MSKFNNLTDTELILSFQEGNCYALEALISRYKEKLFSSILFIVKDKYLAEDLFQDTFLRIIDTLRSKGYKKQSKISGDENSVSNFAGDTAGAARFDTIGLRKQLGSLKPEQRVIIDMAYFGGYTQEEISKETGVPLGTVKTRMRTAILELRKLVT